MTMVGFVLYGSMVLLPVMLQTVFGYPPLQAGIAMAPRGIGSFFMMPMIGVMTGQVRRAQALDGRLVRRRHHADLVVEVEPAGRLLGHLLAAARPGRRDGAAVRAADDGRDGCDPARAHGQRHEPVQPDAQHRRQHRHRDDRHDAGAQSADDDVDARIACVGVRSGNPGDACADARGVHGRRRRRDHRDQPRVRGAVWDGPAPGRDGLVRRDLSAPRNAVSRAHPARAADEATRKKKEKSKKKNKK